jgi:hypothetical protein
MFNLRVGFVFWLFVESSVAIGPRVASAEEILEMVDGWLYEFDDDEDGQLSPSEFAPLIEQMKAQSSIGGQPSAKALTPTLLMAQADGDGDGYSSRSELIDLLKRMKGFDAGHVKRSDAATPRQATAAETPTYGQSHEERMRTKKKRRKKKAKDEV